LYALLVNKKELDMFRGQKIIILFVVIALGVGSACSLSQNFQVIVSDEEEILDDSLENTSLGQQVGSGDVILESIEIVAEDTQGEIIEISVSNQSEEELLFEIPPGLVFESDAPDEQNLMVLDAVVITLDPEETITLTPYVICIEADVAAPSSGSSYQIGYLESGDLLNFAKCVDQQADGTLDQDDFGLQFAVWSITSGENVMDLPELTGVEGGALSEMMEELEAFSELMEGFEEITLSFGEDWLQRCGISIGGEE
jgi:hypothetical protein